MGMTLTRLESEMTAAELLEHVAEMNLQTRDEKKAMERTKRRRR